MGFAEDLNIRWYYKKIQDIEIADELMHKNRTGSL